MLLLSYAGFAQPYHNLVLKGGGVRGIAYIGAMKVLEEKKVTDSLQRVGGTSIGAVVAALISVGYTATEMEQAMMSLDVKTFNDGEWFFIGGQRRMRKAYGWYKGDELEDWLRKAIARKTGNRNLTFGQLHDLALKDARYKDLYVVATNLSRQREEIFNAEHYKDMEIATAVRASASIPLYYGAVLLDSTGHLCDTGRRCDVFADGGLADNYPITLFNTEQDNDSGRINRYTLGLRLERPEQIAYQHDHTGLAPYEIEDLHGYISALYNFVIERMNPRVSHDEEQRHTIYISTSNISPRVRHVTLKQKRLLEANGEAAARSFFAEKQK